MQIFFIFFVCYNIYLINKFIFVFKKNKLRNNILVVLLKFKIRLFFLNNSNNINFKKIKKVFYSLILIFFISMLYKNGVILHPSNLCYGSAFITLANLIFPPMRNKPIIFNSVRLTNIFCDLSIIIFTLFAYSISLNSLRY